jgi:hypothetical protein
MESPTVAPNGEARTYEKSLARLAIFFPNRPRTARSLVSFSRDRLQTS